LLFDKSRSTPYPLNEVFKSLLNFTGKIIVRQPGFHDGIIAFLIVRRQDKAYGKGLAITTLVSEHVFNFFEYRGIPELYVFGGVGAAATGGKMQPLDVTAVFPDKVMQWRNKLAHPDWTA
jgi:hypothetical protein